MVIDDEKLFALSDKLIFIVDSESNNILFLNDKFKQIFKSVFNKISNEDSQIIDFENIINFMKNFSQEYYFIRSYIFYKNRKAVLYKGSSIEQFFEPKQEKMVNALFLNKIIKIFNKNLSFFKTIEKLLPIIYDFFLADKVTICECLTTDLDSQINFEIDRLENKIKTYRSKKQKDWDEIFGDKSILDINCFIKSQDILKDGISVGIKFFSRVICVINVENPKKNINNFSFLNDFFAVILKKFKNNDFLKNLYRKDEVDILTQFKNFKNLQRYQYELKQNKTVLNNIGFAYISLNKFYKQSRVCSELKDIFYIKISKFIKKYFRYDDIYNVEDGNFVLMCKNIKKEVFLEKIEKFKKDINKPVIFIGHFWEEKPTNINYCIKKANYFMFNDINYNINKFNNNDPIKINTLPESDFIINPMYFQTKQKFFNFKVKEYLKKYKNDSFVMVMLDVNNFKAINEMYSFKKGNELLIAINNVINNIINDRGICFHLYSDIYYIFLKSYSDEETISILQSITKSINDLEKNINITLSYGVYRINSKDDTIEEMCEKASYSHKIVKKQPNKTICFYDEKLKQKLLYEKQIENDMLTAIENSQFKVYMQPKYNIFTEEIVGAEALVRWEHPVNGIMTPSSFISIFEKNGFIIKLDLYILEQACKMLKARLDAGKKIVPISINMSRLHFKRDDFKIYLTKIIDKYKIDRSFTELEITENLLIKNTKKIANVLKELKNENFKIAMDDFGTGYSSLSILKDLPIDSLKIDAGFFKNFKNIKKEDIIIRHIVALAKELEINVVAEGIEEEEEVNYLKEIDCDAVQGYYYCKPITIEEFEKKLG